ncbi:MAG: SusC/RagA family TonB-linked outer membrane protein [Rikenellaceae bacterium]
MRKIYFFTMLFLMSITCSWAQVQPVTGVVVSKSDGSAVVGAVVTVVGSTVGTTTNAAGEFSIKAPSASSVLEVAFIGMTTVQLPVKSTMFIELSDDAEEISEVVVTAMGIKRSEKALGYSATTLDSDDITSQNRTDAISGLAGKVAGVQITQGIGAGSSSSVVIRGMSSLSGSNQPLYVIDGVPMTNESTSSYSTYDFGTGSNAVNPSDIESMTILKGAAATALYGSRAAAGVVLINTKTGSKNSKMSVEYSGGVQFESLLMLPAFQTEFGQGWDGQANQENCTWGPAYDGSERLWGNIYDNSQQFKTYLAQEDAIKDFYELGVTYNNNISIQGGNDATTYFASVSQTSSDGIIPTDNDTYQKYTFSTRGSHTYKRVTISSSINYTKEFKEYAGGSSVLGTLYQIPGDMSIVDFADMDNPFNSVDEYFTPYTSGNPYYKITESEKLYESSKLFGKIQFDYKILDNLNFTYRLGLDHTAYELNSGTPEMFASEGSTNYGEYTTYGTFLNKVGTRQELNHDFLLAYDTKVGDFQINAVVGSNINERSQSYLSVDVTDFDIDGWYNLANSSSTPVVEEYESLRRLVGVFGQVEFGYKSLAYLTLTARNDWSSTLPVDNNSFFYPGVTGSFVFTELMPSTSKDILTFGKVRVAWGQTGSDADVYQVEPTYSQSSSTSGSTVSMPLGGLNGFTMGNSLADVNLQPEITTEFEVGATLDFFGGRLNFDGAYYNRISESQIYDLDMDPATGYTSQVTNLGKIRNRGVELLVDVTPIRTRDFTWNVSVNYTKNNSMVLELPEEMGGEATIASSSYTSLKAIEGYPLGVFETQVASYDPNGNPIVSASTGRPVYDTEMQIVGDMNYDYQMGINTSFRYKNLSLSASFDIRQGGLMYSSTKDLSYFTGLSAETVYNDRNPFIVPNSVNEVTDENGNVSYVENTTAVSTGNQIYYWMYGGENGESNFLVDKSYVKLRSLNLAYNLPKKWFAGTILNEVKVSAYGNNLFLWCPSTNTFIDPEMGGRGNDISGQFGEYYSNPSTRTYGFSLSVKF